MQLREFTQILLLGTVLFMPILAESSEGIYKALDIRGNILVSSRIQKIHEKKIGGLTCIKTDNFKTGISYDCNIGTENLDFEGIYNSFDLNEEALVAKRTQIKRMKSVDGLKCFKIDDIKKGIFYTCTLKENYLEEKLPKLSRCIMAVRGDSSSGEILVWGVPAHKEMMTFIFMEKKTSSFNLGIQISERLEVELDEVCGDFERDYSHIQSSRNQSANFSWYDFKNRWRYFWNF